MTEESSQAAVGREGCLIRISRWATAPLVIPLLTGLSFAASTVLAFAGTGVQGYSFFQGKDLDQLSMMRFCLILGIGLGFPLRGAMVRIRDTGLSTRAILVMVGVWLAWGLALFVQWSVLIFNSFV
jgi:hypothetical protein